MLDFQRLHVYQAGLRFLRVARRLAGRLPRGQAYLADQLRRASLSIMTNIAEGSGRPSGPDRARFYAISRGSAYECAAIVESAMVLEMADATLATEGLRELEAIIRMLSKMCR